MILVDTSVWADYFNGVETAQVRRLDQALAAGEALGIVPIILTEVLHGFRSDRGFRDAREVLTRLPLLDLSVGGHVRAASLYRGLRRKGVTVRGAVDCVIAQTAIEAAAELLTSDADFGHIARHSPLALCAAS